MGSWTGFLFAYLLGGLTFLPLLIISVLAHAYYTLPYREDAAVADEDTANDIVQPGDDTSAIRAAQEIHKADYKARAANQDSDVSAGYFAVCREYTPMGINAKPIERATPVGSATVAAPSPSVYQTMYRSLFDRKQSPNPLDSKNPHNQRPKKAGNVFYVVLRHGHLMLFDDDEQLEVRHVISLAHHDVSIYSGGDVTPEGELFIKRNALCLSRRHDGPEVGPDSQLSKPFYLFSEDCSAKEDFYFALLRNQEETMATDRKAPVPMQFSIEHIISLVQKLHSSEDHTHSRWLNAFLGRVFLGVYQTRDLENFIREKITKKISRVKRPSFLSGIKIQGISLGEAAPTITNPRLKDLTVEGECVAEADLRYTGGFRIEVAATARIDLGSRFKVREVPLVLAVVIKKLEGHILLRIKAPPSNRLWFSFQSMPKIEMTIEPIVSTRQITYTLILRQIENRIKEVIAESVVHPFWDDVPFFKTEHKKWRGGIFRDDDAVVPTTNVEDDAAQHGQVDTVDTIEELGEPPANMRPMEKSHSLPMLENSPPTGLFGRKLAPKSPGVTRTASSSSLRGTRLRHVTEANGESEHKSALDREVSAISTATSEPHNDSPSHTPSSSPTRPSQRSGAASSASSLDIKGAGTDSGRTSTLEGEPMADTRSKLEEEEAKSPVSSLKSNSGSLSRGLFRRQDSSASTASGSHPGNDGATKRSNTLAAVTKAAATARTWGWNALQRRADGAKDESHPDGNPSVDLSQPMGRGRPLPPPGVPLPPPERTTKPGRTKTIPIAPPNRKPVQPPRPKQHPEAERAEKVNGHRPVPPPPLPKRRLMADAPEVGDNLLVVAAPEDSQPASPSTEDPPAYKHPFVEDADEGHLATPKPNETEHPDHRERQSSTDEADGVDYDHEDGSHGPITAIPVVDTESDDEGYSGWIDNSGHVDDATTEEGHVTPAMAIERYLAS